MGAGMSRKQFNDRVYKLLKRTQRDLLKAGVPVKYEKYQLFPDMTNDKRDIAFNISYNRLNASNGEVAGIPQIRVQVGAGRIEKYGWCTSPDGDFDKGVARIKELFAKQVPDFTVQNEGSIFLLHPLTPAANAWIEEHIPEDAQYFGNAVVVEHRYIADIVGGIQRDGLTVE